LVFCFSGLEAPSIVIFNFLVAFWVRGGRVTDERLFEEAVKLVASGVADFERVCAGQLIDFPAGLKEFFFEWV